MAENFGLKIGVEGEKEFKNALQNINQSFEVLGSEMNLVASQFDKNDKSIQAVTARNEVLNKEIDAQREKISTLQAALKNAAESFGENDRRTQNWAIQLNNAKAELNGMERELRDSANEAGKLGGELKQTGDEAEKSGGKFGKLSEGYQRGIASNHADVTHWFPRFGKSMGTFREEVRIRLAAAVPSPSAGFSVGDRVILNGAVYADSYGEGRGRTFNNKFCTVTSIVDLTRRCPYLLDNGLGWVPKDSIRKA